MEYIYERKVNYYETDRMGITHHSNYIRFMEEARCEFLEKIGLPYDQMEAEGVMIPVLSVDCTFKHSCTFEDVILIKTKIIKFTGVQMVIYYEITNKETGELLTTGETRHCLTNSNLKPINLKKYNEKMYNILENAMVESNT